MTIDTLRRHLEQVIIECDAAFSEALGHGTTNDFVMGRRYLAVQLLIWLGELDCADSFVPMQLSLPFTFS